MAIVRNLLTVPALAVDASTWFPVPEWARTASAHVSLPRSTAFAGTTAAQVVCSRGTVVAGKFYVFSVSVRAIAPQTATLGIDWRASGGAFLTSTSGAGSDYGVVNMVASSTDRFAIVGQAPPNAVRADPVINGMDAGGAQVTAAMLTEHDTLEAALEALAVQRLATGYLDGDSPGGSWDGDPGESPSTIVVDDAARGVAALAGLQAFGSTRVRRYGLGVAAFAPLVAVSGLIPTAQYDRRRGRIRVQAAGFAPNVVRAIVESRPLGTSRWTQVRGGRQTIVAAALARPVDDYEYRAGGGMEYRIRGLSTPEGQPDIVVQTATVTVRDTEQRVWLKFIPAPWTNVPVDLVLDDWELGQDSRSTVHEVEGTSPPVVVSDVHASTRTSVRLKTNTDADLAALRKALGQGAPAYLQTPDGVPFPTMYVSVGSFVSRRWGGRSSRKYVTTVALTEVAAPPPSVVPGQPTYGTLADLFDTYGDLANAYDSWGQVAG